MFTEGYSLRTDWEGASEIVDVKGAHLITKTGDLESKLFIHFNLVTNYTTKHNNLTIYFYPWERINNEPILNISITVCNYPSGHSWYYDTGYAGQAGQCEKSYNYTLSNHTRERYFVKGNRYLRNYSEFLITFMPEKIEESQQYLLLINYTLPNFIFKQGDYSVAWLSLENLEKWSINMVNSIVLPTNEDIPRFIPEAQKIEIVGYIDQDKRFFRWAFVFKGGEDKIVWYWNDKEIQEKDRKIQEEFTNKGVRRGFWLSIIVAVIIIFSERLFFDWLPIGNRILSWIINKFRPREVIGNRINKKYHKSFCVFVDNINKRNKKLFKNKDEAEKDFYEPCKICHP